MTMTNELVEFSAWHRRKVRGTHVEAGDTLYAIKNIETGLYFIWAYVDKEFATEVMGRVRPENEVDIQANWRRNLTQLVPTGRTKI